ncbi:hypothetical protein BGX29_001937 [Mortierella sp. GBA35]|nr:hypothetical protein BGX23_007681 [Mortierella sp. AD031]KAF9104410.1 hypothetical protein BGX29_001937 [Mortierella sp. GBA35]KAG0208385.1 hypothetical protein BGX33_006300 [Mortierella sp. NVP41]
MSTIAIPNYPQACLAPDHANSAVYLAGVPAAQLGRLEVNYVSVANVNSPVASIVTSLVDTDAWTSSASKTCFIDPSAASLPNPSVKIIQFGNFKTFYTTVRPNGSIDKAVTFGSVSFLSPRLFAWTGTVPKGAFDLYTVYTNITFGHDVTSWMGFRMEFRINYLSYGE